MQEQSESRVGRKWTMADHERLCSHIAAIEKDYITLMANMRAKIKEALEVLRGS